MILIAISAVIYSIGQLLDLHEKLPKYALQAHHFCLQILPRAVENRSSLEALVCGKNMQDLELQHLLAQTSLIHVFIISGSHFLFLHKILARIPVLRFCTLFLLSIYCLATLCQPPAVRALLFLGLVRVARRKHLFTSSVIVIFLSAVLSVCIFPQWITSRSLLMSLLAALTLGVMSEYWGKLRGTLTALTLTQSAVCLVMAFPLWGFSTLHPLSIFLNISLAPLIGGVIFPLALLVVLIPPLHFVFDTAINALTWLLQKTSELLGEPGSSPPLSIFWQWGFFLALATLSYHLLVQRKRKKARNA